MNWQALVVASILNTFALTGAYAQQHTHVHGIAQLNIVVEDNQLMVELHAPMHDIAGFEHAPQTEDDRRILKQVRSLLTEDAQTLLTPSPEARCRINSVEIDSALLDEVLDEHHHDDKGDHEHTDLEAQFLFECTTPSALKQIDVGLFKVFPGFEEIQVQLVTPNKQSAFQLKANSSRISW